MKRLSIILGILLLVAGCGQGKKDDPAASDSGPSAGESELDSLSKISIIKDTTVWQGFNRVNRKGQRVGMWKEVDNGDYIEIEYGAVGKTDIIKQYSLITGSLTGLCVTRVNGIFEIMYSFEDFRHIYAVLSDFRINQESCGNDDRGTRANIYKYKCMIVVFFLNGGISQIEEDEYIEEPEIDGETIWIKYYRKDGTESDINLMEYHGARNRDERRLDVNKTDSLGRRQGLWLEDDGYKEVYYKDGVVDGVFRSYSRETGTLLSIGWYSKGILSGRWFYFDDYGKLLKIKDYPDLEGSPAWLVRHLTPDRNDAHNEQRPDRAIGS